MEKKKVKLGVLLMCLLLFLTLTACGQSEATGEVDIKEKIEDGTNGESADNGAIEEEPPLDFGGRAIRWAAWWDLEPHEGASEWADKMLERIHNMEEKYNFTAEYIEVPNAEFVEIFSASTLAGDPFTDLAEVDSGWFFPGLVANGFIYPVSDLEIFDFEEDKWTDTTVNLGTFKGKVYGFATGDIEPREMIWWNKSMFEREGLPNLYELRDNKQWTWDKMLDIAKKATKDLDGDGIIDQWGIGHINLEWALVVSNGGSLMRMEGDKPIFTLNEPAALEALQFFQDLYILHNVVDVPISGAEWDYPIQRFQDGKTAMFSYEIWMGGQFNENMKDDYGLTLFPMGPRLNEYTSLNTINILTVIPATVTRPEEIAIFYDERSEPFPDDDPEAWKERYEAFARDEETLETIETILRHDVTRFFHISNFPELRKMSWDFMWQISSGNKTAKVAIEEIAQQAQALLEDAFKFD